MRRKLNFRDIVIHMLKKVCELIFSITIALTICIAILLITLYESTYIGYRKKVVVNELEQQIITKNNEALTNSLMEICKNGEILDFNDFVPFEWDKVYFISAYTSVEEVYEKAGYYWDYVPDLKDPEISHTHILFMLNGRVVAYRPNTSRTKPFNISLGEWNEGEYESLNNPKFIVSIIESDASITSIKLIPFQ